MHKQIVPLVALGLMAFALIIYAGPSIPSVMASTITTTIIGWNVPNATNLGNGIVALILPFTVMAMFAGIPLLFEQRGDSIVTMALTGFTIGSVAGMLSLTAVSATIIPFAMVIVSGIFLVIWLWKGAG